MAVVKRQDQVTRTISRVAIIIAAIVAVCLPAGYFALSYQYQIGAMRSEARFTSTLATRYIALNPEIWRYQVLRLNDLLGRDLAQSTLPEQRRIFDAANRIIAASEEKVATPVLSVRAPLFDAGATVGYFEISRSLRPQLIETAFVALLGLVLAAVVFGILKVLPLRALNRALENLRQSEQRMVHLANYDHLTGLPNRALFHDRLAGAMQRAQRAERLVGLLYLDLDRFKQVNDSLGHPFGDQLLKQVAERLQRSMRQTDTIASPFARGERLDATVARLGGDEFTIVLEEIKHIDEVTRIAQRILALFSEPFDLDGHQLYVGASIGITVYPFDDVDIDNLIRAADAAMYRAKALGRNNFQFYTDDLNANAEERLHLETELRQALDRQQFQVVYQPKLDLRTNRITGVEALLRWNSTHKGLILPSDFIPLLEDTGLIVPVGAWVLRTACQQAAAWASTGLNLSMAVNLSVRQFRDIGLTRTIQSILDDTGLPAHQLELEVTESLLMEDSANSQATLTSIKQMGVLISVDDFGTGYSSLAYLKRFPLTTLKIDRSFVSELGSDQENTAIVNAVIALAHSLRLNVVAEGVETGQQLQFLRENHCEQAQGYFISRPLQADAVEPWLAQYHEHKLLVT